jgi:hypothetical protein
MDSTTQALLEELMKRAKRLNKAGSKNSLVVKGKKLLLAKKRNGYGGGRGIYAGDPADDHDRDDDEHVTQGFYFRRQGTFPNK